MKTRLQLNDEQWSRIEFILPGRECHPGRTASDNRAFVEAVLYVARTGIPWRDLPDSASSVESRSFAASPLWIR
jgi:transposase